VVSEDGSYEAEKEFLNTKVKCGICGNHEANTMHSVPEMMLGLRTRFSYLECRECGALQLTDPPENMELYYPPHYYSFKFPQPRSGILQKSKQYFRRIRNRTYFNGISPLGYFLDRVFPYLELRPLRRMMLDVNTRVLDVGCGSGALLLELRDLGFTNLLGIDPFIDRDIHYENGLHIKKGTLEDLVGTVWDAIIFNHSFEHISDPSGALALVSRLLSGSGQCLIRVPVAAWPWKNYGTCWVELDAPRHFFLHTEQSMAKLAQQVGLRLAAVDYDSDEFQFWGSELYARNIPLRSLDKDGLSRMFTKREMKRFRQRARILNQNHEGGRAAFYIMR
jgi:SAM-dependent methyltransferase